MEGDILLWRSARYGTIHAASRSNHKYTICGQFAFDKDLVEMQGPRNLVTCKRCAKGMDVEGVVRIEEYRQG